MEALVWEGIEGARGSKVEDGRIEGAHGLKVEDGRIEGVFGKGSTGIHRI